MLLGEWLVFDIVEEHSALIFKDYLALIILYTVESQFKFLNLRYSCIWCSFCGPGQNPMQKMYNCSQFKVSSF